MSVMAWNPCFCIKLKVGCYVVGVMFLFTTGLNLYLSMENFDLNYSRSLQINTGFQIIFLMPCLPLFVGIYLEIRELLVPFMVTAAYSVVLCIVMISNMEMPRDVMFFICWTFTIICNLYSVVVISCFWKQLTKDLHQDVVNEKKLLRSYPYRRFGN